MPGREDPRRAKAGRARGRRQVEQRPDELVADRLRFRRPGEGQGDPPPARREPGQPGGGRGSATGIDQPLHLASGSGPSRTRAQRDRTVGSSSSSRRPTGSPSAPAGGSSRVLSSADWATSFMRCACDDRDPIAALDRKQGEVQRQPANGARLGMLRLADPDLVSRPRRRQPVQVGVVAVLDHPAAAALTTGPIRLLGW